MNKIILTGDRPTGKLHLGHYVGSLKKRVELQNSGEYTVYVFIADMQALTDNARNPVKVRDNVFEVALDYLSVGIDPDKTIIFVQSQIPELTELTTYYMNLVTLARLERNPTIKNEIKERGFGDSIPVGFLNYPISQAADITAFNANIIPVGDDQLPLVEQTREIVKTFNSVYGDVLVMPEALVESNEIARRLPGIDGASKMSKSSNNCIYLSDSSEVVLEKVMGMYTDPNHIRVEDKGVTKNNPVFMYLEVFVKEDSFSKFLPEYQNLEELKKHYENGGLGDIKVKRFLYNVLEEELKPIREKRKYYEDNRELVIKMLKKGSEEARVVANNTLKRVRKAIGVEYFN